VSAPTLDAAEGAAFERWGGEYREAPVLFLLGAPRTGSTLAYQALVNAYHLAYLSNLVNDVFPRHPILGLLLHARLEDGAPVPYRSSFGKTAGPLGPSEASAVVSRWCGGGHPSEQVSATVLADQVGHLRRTAAATWGALARPLTIKNAWNCFRVPALADALPGARFLWIRRDAGSAAISDLESRRHLGSLQTWNSASPADYEELRKRPYWEQGVEQQAGFHRVLSRDLGELPGYRWASFWYEDFCRRPGEVLRVALDRLAAGGLALEPRGDFPDAFDQNDHRGSEHPDHRKIWEFLDSQGRFADLRYPAHGPAPSAEDADQ